LIVVDTNIIAYFFINGRFSEAAEKVFGTDRQWAAPVLWRSEFRSVLAKCVGKGYLGLEDAFEIAAAAETMMAGREYAVSSLDVLRLAASAASSAYDAEFIALAQELGIRLVTADTRLQKAFPGTAFSPDRFVAGE
jgi:predicted nucleic acid-binding protein